MSLTLPARLARRANRKSNTTPPQAQVTETTNAAPAATDGSEGQDAGHHLTPTMPDLAQVKRDEPVKSLGAFGHLQATESGVVAWYRIRDVDWFFRAASERDRTLNQQAHAYADLVGHEITLRGVTNPFSDAAWEERMRNATKWLPDREGGMTQDEILAAYRQMAIDLDAGDSVVFLGVRLSSVRVPVVYLPHLLSETPLTERLGALEETRQTLIAVTNSVTTKAGFAGVPLSEKAMHWNLNAGVGLGGPVPAVHPDRMLDGWDIETVAQFTDDVDATCAETYSPTVRFATTRGGGYLEYHACIQHVLDVADRDPSGSTLPWLGWLAMQDEQVEWVAHGWIRDGKDMMEEATRARKVTEASARHLEEMEETPPPLLEASFRRGRSIEEELSDQDRTVSTRFVGVILVASFGETETAAISAAERLRSAASREVGINLKHGFGQYGKYLQFIPGNPADYSGFVTRQSLVAFAAAVPTANAKGGDRTGWLVGNIAGGHSVFQFDFHGGSRRNKPNVVTVGGAPGHGKSSFAGWALATAARSGIRAVGTDPSGMWCRIGKVPDLAEDFRNIELGKAGQGTLVPHLLIPDPERVDYDDDDEYKGAVASAKEERSQLCINAFCGLLPRQMLTTGDGWRLARMIEGHVRAKEGAYGVNPWEILDAIRRDGTGGKDVAEQMDIAIMSQAGRLVFPERSAASMGLDKSLHLMEQATLTIVSMQGMTMPPRVTKPRTEWTPEELRAETIMELASRFATRAMYADRKPKVIALDELGLSTAKADIDGGAASVFTSLITRCAYDTRKWAGSLWLLWQNPHLLLQLEQNISNLVGSLWVGQMDPETAREVVPLLGLRSGKPGGHGFHETIAGLGQAEFLVRHWTGPEVRHVHVSRAAWSVPLRESLGTNPYGEEAMMFSDDDVWGSQ